jgi:parallel beta-helix repeat protein
MKKNGNKKSFYTRKIFLYVGILALFVFGLSLITTVTAQDPEFISVKLEQSTNLIDWNDIDGTQATGFIEELNNSVIYHYLNVKYAATNVTLQTGYFGFNLITFPPGFFDYWEAKGVDENAAPGTWQGHMWDIINGTEPTFYIYVAPDQTFTLIDGLQRDFFGDSSAILRVNGDYPRGDYSYQGNISSQIGDISNIIWNIEFVDDIDDYDAPHLLGVNIIKSPDQSDWTRQFGTIHSFYSCPKNSSITYYWLDGTGWNVDGDLAEDCFGFYLNSYPSGYFAYWASRGVDASAGSGTWQGHMWRIINGEAPRFYICYDSEEGISLIDGLYRDFTGYGILMPFRIYGDVTEGLYRYSGTLTNSDGIDSHEIELDLSFIDENNYVIWVDNNYDPSTPGWGVDHFNMIEDGINACVDYGLVNVQPGTYKDVFEIDKPLILKSVWGPLSTTISDFDSTYSELLETNGYTVLINSSHVLLSNFTIERFESVIRNAAVGTNPGSGLNHVEINYCEIESFYDCIRLFDVDYGATSHNVYDSQIGRTTLKLENISVFQILSDEIDGYDSYAVHIKGCNNGYIGNLDIQYRRITGFIIEDSDVVKAKNNYFSWTQDDGIFINNSDEINISENIFVNCTNGIRLGENTIAFIKDNTYTDETDRSIYRAVKMENQYLHYSQLQDIINIAEVGQDLLLYEGNYTENILIEKPIKLHGLYDPEETIIVGDNSTPAILIANDSSVRYVLLDSISIQGGNHCLKTGMYDDISGLNVKNCVIKNPLLGYAVYIDPHNFSDESAVRNGTGLFFDPVIFEYCDIVGGLYYQFWPFEIFTASVPEQLVLQYNFIDEIFLNGSTSVIIENNEIQSLGMVYSSNIQILSNTFENSIDEEKRYGVYLWSVAGTPDVTNVDIRYNSFLEYRSSTVTTGVSGKGILIAGAKDITVRNNAIRACSDGIWVTENYTNRNGEVCIGEIIDLEIKYNDFVLCQSGIRYLDNANGSNINNNTFDRNQQGIRLFRSGFHTITGNTFVDNYEGLRIDQGSSNNLIFNNFFDNTAVNAQDRSSSGNIWNVSLRSGKNILGGPYIGGNFWNDYTGSDTDGDTIGDTNIPYNGSGNISIGGDYLPIILTDFNPPFIRLDYPNGGESVNGTISIQWTAYDDFDDNVDIDIEYSDDNGETWRVVATNEENDGSYDWDLSALPDGDQYLVRVTATDNAAQSSNDTSDFTFTIYREYPNPVVDILHPLQGYIYFFDMPYLRFLTENTFTIGDITIRAQVESPIEIVKVEFYVDDQKVNTENTSIDGVFSWNWDESTLFYHIVKVIAYDEYDRTGEAEIGLTMFNLNIIP